MRTGLLAEELASRGHDVLWWGTNFYHQKKEILSSGEEDRNCGERLKVRLLQGLPYKKNYSYRRHLHHKNLARRFVCSAAKETPPDLILAALPVHNLAYQAVCYGQSRGIPVLVDVRDPWPDIFVDQMPLVAQLVGRFLLRRDFQQARYALQHARAIVSMCDSYLQWALNKAGRGKTDEDRIFYLGALPMDKLVVSEKATQAKFPWLQRLDGKLVLGFIGTFGRNYDLMLVVKAARALYRKNNRHIHFLLGGEGENYDRVKGLAKGLPNVTFTGWLDKEGSSALLNRADVGLVPYVEGASNTLTNKVFQYMSAGMPVISSLTVDFPRLIAEHHIGFNYRGGSVDDFLVAVEEFVARPDLLKKMAAKAQDVFWEKFNSNVIYKEFADYLEHMASQGDKA